MASEVNHSFGGRSKKDDPAPRDRIIQHKLEHLEIDKESIEIQTAKTIDELRVNKGDLLVIKPKILQNTRVLAIDLVKNGPG